jgi:outer membrane receptor for ferrienterochelin and colicin
MNRLALIRVGFVLSFLFLAVGAFGQSQATTGVIEGTVTDATGGVLPGVTVTLRNTATNFEQVQVTDSGGRFRGVLLPLGPYEAKAQLEGFSTQVVKGLDLRVGQTLMVELKLGQAAVSEELIVTAAAPLIETARTEGATRLSEEAVSDLPNNGRNFLELTKLTPGVTIVQGPDGDELSINGQKGISNNISVDGADFNNPFFGEQRGGQRPAFTFNLDAVKELVVVADGANAEFGRSQSGFVNVITKSGTNETNGTAHFVFKNDSLSSNAKKADGSEAPKFDSSQYQTGFTLGGPLVPDKFFYFTAFDFQKAESTKQTETSRIEQRVVDALASLGITNENGPITRSNDARVLLVKGDWNASQKNLVTLRYNYTWSEQENGTFDVDSWGRSANAIEKDFSHAGSGSVISSFTSNLLNELRFQYAREDRPRPYNGANITGQNRPLPDTAFDFGRSYRFGMPFFIPVEYYDTRVQLNDNVSVLRGAHSIKFGGEYNRVSSVQTFVGFANGRWVFDSTQGFLEDLTNRTNNHVLLYLQQAGVGSLSAEEAGTQSIPQTEPAVFIQDAWQATPNLNVQYGLRWEAEIEPDPITPASQVYFAPFIGKTVQGQEFPSDGTIPSDYNMWQPRFGVAWTPNGDGTKVFRASAGIFYGRIPGLSLASSRSTNGSRGQTIFRSSAVNFDGCLPVYPNLLAARCIGAPDHPDVFVFDKDFQNPRTTSASVSWEQELVKDYAFLVKYNYAKGDHITRFVNRNDPVLINAPNACTFACGPWSSGLGAGGGNGVGALTTVESSAKSLYQGVTLGITKRPSHNVQLQAYYTYSKDKSDDDNERDPFTFRYAKVTELDKEYSYSDRDQRHRFNSFLLWNAPYGVDLNLRYSYRSAQPKSITATGANAASPADRCSKLRADGTCAADAVVTRRNLGRKDNEYSSLDFRLSKQFAVGGVTFEPALDVFNLFNAENFRRPEVTSLVFNFDGTVQSGNGDPRQMQLALRVLW